MSPTNWKHLLHRIGIWTCWLLRRRENRSKGASSAVLLKVGGWGRWYQSTPERNFKLKLFFLVQTRRNVKIAAAPKRCPYPGLCNLVSLWKIYECWFIPKLHEKNHVITYTNITVLGIILKKEGGGRGEEDSFFFVTTACTRSPES